MLLSLLPPMLLLLQWSLTSGATDPIYLLTVSSQVVGGSTQTLCAQIHEPKEALSIVVTLRTDNSNLTILQQGSIKKEFHKCVHFKVPVVTVGSVAFVDVEIQGNKTSLNQTIKILINPPKNLYFIQSDKPIYKPGQTIKFRIVSLHSNLSVSNCRTPEAAQGYYTINAWDDKNQQISHSFEIKEYVLPKYEVNIDFPLYVTFKDKEVTLKVCAKYTYGKPVLGSVNAEVCRQNKECKKYSLTTDKTGCGSQAINVTEIGLTLGESFQVNCSVEESGTGITMQGSTSAVFIRDYAYVNFEDTPYTYRPGMVFKGKVVVTNPQSSVMKNESVIIYARYGDKSVILTLTTDINGTVHFFFNTSDWSELPVIFQAYLKRSEEWTDFEPFIYYPSGFHYVSSFHSNSKSFLMLTKAPEKLSCNSDATVTASYIIQSSALKTGQKTLDFFYIVMSRGRIVQTRRLSVNVSTEKENKGELTFTLKKTAALSPYAQVVVYTVLPNRETVADSMNFPIEECLPNKVSLNFSSPTALPGEKISLNLKAKPGSLCSVRAIDQSVLLLKPEAELDAAAVLRMLPVQMLSDYPFDDEESCSDPSEIPFAKSARRKRSFYDPYHSDKTDVYNIFKEVGIKIITNSDVKSPFCHYGIYKLSPMDNGVRMNLVGPDVELGLNVERRTQNIRKSFPETWIWDLIPVGKSGSVNIAKTVPDTITKWAAGAFCTSRVGFGVAPKTDLTAFKPFFVSLALPYSVIREETFTLRATVFNYLPKCIMVKATLADSPQFTAQPCEGCTYSQCVCSEESQTFQWIITPSELGKVNITVHAEAVQSQELCGNEVVTLPDKGRVDTVMQSVLVQAEGTKQSITQNELICLTDRPYNTSVNLTLPNVFVKGSAKSFVTVRGDLMGHALRNIRDLLAMPYGCGEQNMLHFAPNIYILQYLESSGQQTSEIKNQAITFLKGEKFSANVLLCDACLKERRTLDASLSASPETHSSHKPLSCTEEREVPANVVLCDVCLKERHTLDVFPVCFTETHSSQKFPANVLVCDACLKERHTLAAFPVCFTETPSSRETHIGRIPVCFTETRSSLKRRIATWILTCLPSERPSLEILSRSASKKVYVPGYSPVWWKILLLVLSSYTGHTLNVQRFEKVCLPGYLPVRQCKTLLGDSVRSVPEKVYVSGYSSVCPREDAPQLRDPVPPYVLRSSAYLDTYLSAQCRTLLGDSVRSAPEKVYVSGYSSVCPRKEAPQSRDPVPPYVLRSSAYLDTYLFVGPVADPLLS
ncbi:alpha-2-macroglobulin-P-like [Garra rufa]|uniref:alpha-2-macroglobulin-P-like n=1 Tax=Garra rufa TaxID=137080 RepID=UPI003CCE8B22